MPYLIWSVFTHRLRKLITAVEGHYLIARLSREEEESLIKHAYHMKGERGLLINKPRHDRLCWLSPPLTEHRLA